MNTPYDANTTQGEVRPILSSSGQKAPKTLKYKSRPEYRLISTQFFSTAQSLLDILCYHDSVMFSESYKQAVVGLLDAAKREKNELLGKRLALENELEEIAEAMQEIQQQIQQLEDLALRGIVVETTDNDRPLTEEKSFTRAIAFVLKGASRPLSPMEIRDRLLELGFDSSEWKTDVVSSVHTVLKRLLSADPPKVEESGEPRRKLYQWNWEAGRTPGSEHPASEN